MKQILITTIAIRRTLKKDLSHKKIAGVCAGIAQYLDISRFCVRTAAVISLFVAPQFALLAYGIAYFVLDDSYPSGRRNYDT
ncbi:MAG: PspC domain-containing protein [Pseudomonadales bacterium]|nr:PspC domain-containing protein [Pseudomonadales bacterium]